MLSALDLAGWVGGALGAAAYVLVSRGRIAPGSTLFQGMNMVGAAMLASSSLARGAMPSAVMNLAWILFGMHALTTAARVRRRTPLTVVTVLPDLAPAVPADDTRALTQVGAA